MVFIPRAGERSVNSYNPCLAYSQRGHTCGEALAKTGQPQSGQLITGSPSIPRTIDPQRRPPQGPVPTPVRLLTCSNVLAPA